MELILGLEGLRTRCDGKATDPKSDVSKTTPPCIHRK